jgi:hypothetical protein
MKKRIKLAFAQLEKEMQELTPIEKMLYKGGYGVVTGGTGTASDPYIISETFFYSSSMSADAVCGLRYAVSGYNNVGTFTGGDGKVYQYNFTFQQSSNPSADAPSALFNTGTGASYQYGVAVSDASLSNLSSGHIFGQTNGGSSIAIDETVVAMMYGSGIGSVFNGAYNSIPGQSDIDFYKSIFEHEMGHTLGAVDLAGAGSDLMNQVGIINDTSAQTSFLTTPGNITAQTSSQFGINTRGGIINSFTM